ncbi:MAG: DNA-binding protein [Roseiarcus sp.]|jgi:hypothetical protein
MSDDETEFSKDLLRGAEAIAEFLYGDVKFRRAVYHLAATSNVPTFKLGAMLCARKSVLLKFIESQEGRHANDNTPQATNSVRNGKV